jgi:hypothetical protein
MYTLGDQFHCPTNCRGGTVHRDGVRGLSNVLPGPGRERKFEYPTTELPGMAGQLDMEISKIPYVDYTPR